MGLSGKRSNKTRFNASPGRMHQFHMVDNKQPVAAEMSLLHFNCISCNIRLPWARVSKNTHPVVECAHFLCFPRFDKMALAATWQAVMAGGILLESVSIQSF